ncbi:MAG: response regulator transcription factor [Oscillospiraceae bacterium]|nr:response regulator transcription factor [Oscillospiraceae bacterium]
MSYNVLIVEDQLMPRQLLEIFVTESGRYHLTASISNAALALTFCRSKPIDLILMDVMTEFGASGLDASEAIKREFPAIKIIIVTSMPEATWIARARSIGVDSFWYKEVESAPILEVMDRTMAGEQIFPDCAPSVPIGLTDSSSFTDRELEVLRELQTGDSNTEIGRRLAISPETVKYHIRSLLQKTGFHTRTELALAVRSLGIVIK